MFRPLLTLLACTSTEDDSSKGRGGGNSGPGEAELVIDNPKQILPCYILHFQ